MSRTTTADCGSATAVITVVKMTRKAEMRKGFVARTFHIPIDIDDELRVMAVKNHVKFSEEATLAFKTHISNSKEKVGKK